MKRLHLYRCTSCELDFGVAESFEDQSIITCPSCKIDTSLKDYLKTVSYNTIPAVDQRAQSSLYVLFEGEFGRPLSPMEIQQLDDWVHLDMFPVELIKLALREALLANVRNFKYINRILLNWKTNNIQTVEDARRFSQSFRNKRNTATRKTTKEENDTRPTIPFYNWLEE